MPLFMRHLEEAYQWGVWKTDETIDELLAILPYPDTYQEGLQRFTSEHRRLEWLAVRVLLFTMLGKDVDIAYLSNGKPVLPDRSISISHTRGYVSVILGGKGAEVGIDIEQYGERVHKVAHKYMREDEVSSIYKNTDTWSLLLHWSAKEVMFKCMNVSEVDFRDHLHIYPFIVGDKGIFHAEEYRTAERKRFSISYLLYDDFVLTWTVV